MKIYHTITLKAILGSLLISIFLNGMVTFASKDFSAFLKPEFYATTATITVIIFYTVLGDAHFLRLNTANAGYKYFRSIPNAYERFFRHSLTFDIILLFIGLLLIIPVIITGFTNSLSTISYGAYMLIYAIYHFANAFIKVNNSGYTILKSAIGGIIGMSTVIFGLTLSEFSIFESISFTASIIIITASTLLTIISLVTLYTRFSKKWNEC